MSRNVHGFSILDAVVGLGMAMFLMSALGVFVLFQNQKLGSETRTLAAQQGMRAGLELLVADLREAGARGAGVAYASRPGRCLEQPGRLRVTLDRDGDATVDGAGEDVTYCRCAASSTVYRVWRETDGAPFTAEVLADSISALEFQYDARSVTIATTVGLSTPLGPVSETSRTRAFHRNPVDATSCPPGPACPPAECGAGA